MKRSIITIVLLFVPFIVFAYEPEYSTAGFFHLKNTGREVYSMNPAWRFYKGMPQGDPSKVNYDDSSWSVVSLPNGIEYVTENASGCVNYQGIVWYRKHFKIDKRLEGKKLFVHFEAIMGKSDIYVNGKLVRKHYGGYLPIVVDATNLLRSGEDNIISVMADNSDDPNYPPGKKQDMLDYTYFGGIYRDCWLVATNDVFITDPNNESIIAGGGFFFANKEVSEKQSKSSLSLHIRNERTSFFSGNIEVIFEDKKGEKVCKICSPITINPKESRTIQNDIIIKKPYLWTPYSPNLYNVYVRIYDKNGQVIDGYRQRVGIRSVEFKGKEGFYLNGKPYPKPLIGANRHQDFAVVGNAVSNSAHWRDAKKLKDLGLEIIRNSHCPQDPAFMDACDELGLFVIVNTPGWQFWNDDPIFEQRVFDDIRNVVRRDRNHPSVCLWEPVLNETWYPISFAKSARAVVESEFPYPFVYSACDDEARGAEFYNVQFCHPKDKSKMNDSITYFTREWGDNVDDWSSHNSPSRVDRSWGEYPMLVQANHYANPYYEYTCYNSLYEAFNKNRQHIGGALWHPFDHQRGYHPDSFYGGLMDSYRQPKYSYYMFKSQRDNKINKELISDSGPVLFIANDMNPFSPRDVSVFSNCDEVRLRYTSDGKFKTLKRNPNTSGMPSPIMLFSDSWEFQKDKALTRDGRPQDVFIEAQGIVGGKVVITEKVYPSRRAEQIRLRMDNEGMRLKADGSDFVVVIAEMTDKNGNVKRLNNDYIKFEVSGEGRILGDDKIMANPKQIKWGSAPILVQSTTNPGKIYVKASVLYQGSQKAISDEIIIETVKPQNAMIYDKLIDAQHTYKLPMGKDINLNIEDQKKTRADNELRLKEVEKQQSDFGEKGR